MKTAVIGVGRMGRRHIQVVRDLGLNLVGVCDRRADSLSLAAKEQGVKPEQQFTNASELLEKTKPECVIVATTAPTHCAYTCLAASAGVRYILCEKPMGVSLAECDRMIEACRAHGVKLAINHQMRFLEQYTEAKRIVYSEEFGGLSSITMAGYNLGIAMNGPHYFEMFRYMTDEAPAEVTAWLSKHKIPNPRGPEFEDRAGAVRLTTPSGKRFYMEIGEDHGYGIKVIYCGPYGMLLVDELVGEMYLSVRDPESRNLSTTRYNLSSTNNRLYKISPPGPTARTECVLRALLNGGDAPSGEDGRCAVAALVAAYVSDENGNIPVHIDDAHLPLERVFPWA